MENNKSNQITSKEHKFNIIDIVVLTIIVAIIGAIILWRDPFNWINKEQPKQEKTILVVVELKELDKKQSNTVKVNDNVVLDIESISIGKVIDITKANSYKWGIPNEGDQMILLINPNKETLYVTIEIECLYQEGVGYFLENHQLFVGNIIGLKFPMFEINGECVSISIKQ